MKIDVRDFNLKHIFECGQCFRWNANLNGSYTVVAGNRIATLSMEYTNAEKTAGILNIDTASCRESEEFWRNYLDLYRDYGKIKEVLAERDDVMRRVIPFGGGIRILKQDSWEATVSFLISQNNNIPRINNNIRDLSKLLGESIGFYAGEEYFGIPSPEALAKVTEEELAPVRLGYRAKYLIETAKCIVSKGRQVIESDVKSLCGVGPKVANCINLFGLGKVESFPIDVWIKKTMTDLYGIKKDDEMKAYAEKTFGEYAGIAQQYLFYYVREVGK